MMQIRSKKIEIEVDGPSYCVEKKPKDHNVLKRRQVAEIDAIRITSVPYWEWNALGGNRRRSSNISHCRGFDEW